MLGDNRAVQQLRQKPFIFFLFNIFIGVYLLYNIVLVSTLKQSATATCIHISPYTLPLAPPSHALQPTFLGGHKAPSCSPCAMQLLPTSYLFYVWQCIYVHATVSLVPAYHSPSPYPQVHSLVGLHLYSHLAPSFF